MTVTVNNEGKNVNAKIEFGSKIEIYVNGVLVSDYTMQPKSGYEGNVEIRYQENKIVA